MVRSILFCCTIWLVSSTTAVLAQEQRNPLNVRNAGVSTCKQFLDTFSQPKLEITKTAFLQWIAGYSTAASRASNVVDVFPINDTMELISYVALVCRESPQATLETAAFQGLTRLRPFWVRESPNRLTLTWNDRKTEFYEAAVRPLQEELVQAGFEISVDGAYGNQTGNAVQSLSRQIGLQPTPFPTGALLYALTRPSQ